MEIARRKGPDELLNWEDIRKMRYSSMVMWGHEVVPPWSWCLPRGNNGLRLQWLLPILRAGRLTGQCPLRTRTPDASPIQRSLILQDSMGVDLLRSLSYPLEEDLECAREKNLPGCRYLFSCTMR
ncbi:hypothetical protein CDL15_Pgr015498 [Punica granatum]|uniref:Uncharacterized protein n=1 Tax=Punica granatum TaxID=22663 RepID=A0A218W1C1_PUNGR|nr:hypothetical protein CDL15_Pgr015498 [Punica granatum]PKI76238.1 hypothetical protein CRG98_003349 [Punica granatum]